MGNFEGYKSEISYRFDSESARTAFKSVVVRFDHTWVERVGERKTYYMREHVFVNSIAQIDGRRAKELDDNEVKYLDSL